MTLAIDFEFVWHSGIFLLACLVLLWIAKLSFRLFFPGVKPDHELVEKDNAAYAAVLAGYMLGLLFAILGILSSDGDSDIWTELAYTGAYGAVVILLLPLSALIHDKIILRKISLKNEIVEEQNLAAGIIKGANLVASGVILFGVLLVDAEHPWMALLFWGVAQVFVFAITLFYDLITPFKVSEQIKRGNVALALAVAGLQIAFAILVQWGIQVEHSEWPSTLLSILIDVGIGVLMLPVIRFILDRIFLPSRNLTDEIVRQKKPNVGAGLLEAVAYITGALLFVWCWNL